MFTKGFEKTAVSADWILTRIANGAARRARNLSEKDAWKVVSKLRSNGERHVKRGLVLYPSSPEPTKKQRSKILEYVRSVQKIVPKGGE